MSNGPSLVPKWQKEFDARRFARALLMLLRHLDEEKEASETKPELPEAKP